MQQRGTRGGPAVARMKRSAIRGPIGGRKPRIALSLHAGSEWLPQGQVKSYPRPKNLAYNVRIPAHRGRPAGVTERGGDAEL